MKNVFFMLIYMSVTIFLSGHGIKSDSTVSYSSILSNKRTDCPVSLKELFFVLDASSVFLLFYFPLAQNSCHSVWRREGLFIRADSDWTRGKGLKLKKAGLV